MKIERIDENTIKCFLSMEELQEYDISYKDFIVKSDKARLLMDEIISQAEEEVGYEPPEFAFDMQIMMIPDQGMVLTFSDKGSESLPREIMDCLKGVKDILEGGKDSKELDAAAKEKLGKGLEELFPDGKFLRQKKEEKASKDPKKVSGKSKSGEEDTDNRASHKDKEISDDRRSKVISEEEDSAQDGDKSGKDPKTGKSQKGTKLTDAELEKVEAVVRKLAERKAALGTVEKESKEPSKPPAEAFFSFQEMNEVCRFAAIVPDTIKIKSQLYSADGSYYLLLGKGRASYMNFSKVCVQAMEFGRLDTAAEPRISYLKEQCECLIEVNALKKLRKI